MTATGVFSALRKPYVPRVTLHFSRAEKIPLGDIFDFSKAKSPWGGELNMFAEFAEKNLEAEMAAWELNFDEALDIIDID
ncbi:hypothetical protein HGRIS_014336 [Hohenbuehelia grisea]|uniref:Uncharacterized protein n=1 Tax=Hohenbuehelia grisea TaxID=104357 RepID=A0ABR3JT21_9AGAR